MKINELKINDLQNVVTSNFLSKKEMIGLSDYILNTYTTLNDNGKVIDYNENILSVVKPVLYLQMLIPELDIGDDGHEAYDYLLRNDIIDTLSIDRMYEEFTATFDNELNSREYTLESIKKDIGIILNTSAIKLVESLTELITNVDPKDVKEVLINVIDNLTPIANSLLNNDKLASLIKLLGNEDGSKAN